MKGRLLTLKERTRAVGMCPAVITKLGNVAATKALGNCIAVPTMVLILHPLLRAWLEQRRNSE